MENIINQVLDLPAMVNSKLPKNTFNECIDGSENSVKGWVGLIYKAFALVFLLTMLYGVIMGGIESLTGEGDALSKVGSVLSILILIYAAFPLAQIIRNAGDSLASSSSGIISFIFKDVVVTNIRAVGYLTALSAFFGAVVLTVSYVLNAEVFTYGAGLMGGLDSMTAMPMGILEMLLGTIGMGEVSEIISGLYQMDFMGSASGSVQGWTLEGLGALALNYVAVLVMLIQLFISLAVYHFIYGLAETFVNWIKGPYLPFKSL
jgi:hypothetical protein